jgi:hypothetical protein
MAFQVPGTKAPAFRDSGAADPNPVKTSVIIPTFNRAGVVCDALASVLGQTRGDLEVLVMDDGSTDDTADRVVPFLGDGRVRYLRGENRGPAAARNRGVAMSRGELVSFLDSDDLWQAEKLEREVGFLDEHAEAQAVFCDVEKYDDGVYTPSFMRESPAFFEMIRDLPPGASTVFSRSAMYLCLLNDVPVKPSAFTCRRHCLDELGGLREDLRCSEDWDFFLRFAKRYRFGYLNESLATLRVRKDSLHRETAVLGWLAAWTFLANELQSQRGDRAVGTAARRGIGLLSKHLGWHYLAHNDWRSAVRVHTKGFVETRDPVFLPRVAKDIFVGLWATANRRRSKPCVFGSRRV